MIIEKIKFIKLLDIYITFDIMKIGIVTSWNENLYLFEFLSTIDAEYVVYYDSAQWPYDDKRFETNVDNIKRWIEVLIQNGCQKIIISPLYELYFRLEWQYNDLLVPLYENYLRLAISASLVGKIWVLTDHASMSKWEEILARFTKSIELTENQKKIGKFHNPLKWWIKEVPMWNYLLRRLSPREYFVDKVVKFDLRYFKDANVDTILPLQYSYFQYQNTIVHYFTASKQKFHKKNNFIDILSNSLWKNTSDWYHVRIIYSWSTHMLEENKLLLWTMTRWKKIDLVWEEL